jgi:hypothetical protein
MRIPCLGRSVRQQIGVGGRIDLDLIFSWLLDEGCPFDGGNVTDRGWLRAGRIAGRRADGIAGRPTDGTARPRSGSRPLTQIDGRVRGR